MRWATYFAVLMLMVSSVAHAALNEEFAADGIFAPHRLAVGIGVSGVVAGATEAFRKSVGRL